MQEDDWLEMAYEARTETETEFEDRFQPCANCGRYDALRAGGDFCSARCAREFARNNAPLIAPSLREKGEKYGGMDI